MNYYYGDCYYYDDDDVLALYVVWLCVTPCNNMCHRVWPIFSSRLCMAVCDEYGGVVCVTVYVCGYICVAVYCCESQTQFVSIRPHPRYMGRAPGTAPTPSLLLALQPLCTPHMCH